MGTPGEIKRSSSVPLLEHPRAKGDKLHSQEISKIISDKIGKPLVRNDDAYVKCQDDEWI